MSDVFGSIAVAALLLALLFIPAQLALHRRIRSLEDYSAKRREAWARFSDSDAAREFEEWRKRWSAS